MEVIWADTFYYSIFFGDCWMLVCDDLRRPQKLLRDLY